MFNTKYFFRLPSSLDKPRESKSSDNELLNLPHPKLKKYIYGSTIYEQSFYALTASQQSSPKQKWFLRIENPLAFFSLLRQTKRGGVTRSQHTNKDERPAIRLTAALCRTVLSAVMKA